MTIRLPDLAGSPCRNFGICGTLKSHETAGIKWIKKNQSHDVTRTRINRQMVYIHAVFGHTSFDGHCHLEVATKAYFRSVPKKDTTTWEKIQAKFESLKGKQLEAEIEGVYALPIDRLPTIIKMTRNFDVVQGGISIEMTGGRLRITGAPIYGISWSFVKEPKDELAIIRLDARAETEINEDYMIRMFGILQEGFRSFIESGVPRGPE